ncbi:MAG TPA: hypothetical protein VK421_04760 [Pyrinomonadaceae bacterium]|nr:hypothetical protein [Pyrinomonadaceae bacterium]
MLPFTRLRWPEMRAVALELVARVHEGHARGVFRIPVVDFVAVFSHDARPAELRKVRERGDLMFAAETDSSGSFKLAEGERALFDLQREGLVLRIPPRVSGRYLLRPGAFRVEFNAGEELEGCKRVLLLVCNRVLSVDVSGERVEVRSPRRIFDLLVEF